MTDAVRTVRAVVRGRVQGVGYRAWTERHAVRRGLTGSVRNRPDGSVEAILHGPAGSVDDMLAAMREGPSGAVVEELSVDVLEADDPAASGIAGGFEVRPTA